MRFTTTAGLLADAVERAGRVVPRSPSQTVYAGVRLQVKGDVLTVTGSDEGETTVTISVPVSAAKNGQRVVIPRPLAAFVGSLPADESVTVTADTGPDLQVLPQSGQPYTFRVMEATFPNPAPPAESPRATDLTRLREAVRAVKASAERNKIVQLVSTTEGAFIHATDSIQLASAHLAEGAFGSFSGLLQLGVLELMSEYEPTQVALDSRKRVFTIITDTAQVTARLVNDVFPNVEPMVNQPQPHFVSLPKRETLRALARLSAVSDSAPVVFHVLGDVLTLTTSSDSVGTGTEEVELPSPASSEVRFGINMGYVRGALSSHNSAEVSLEWFSPEQGIYLKSWEPFPITTIVMPVRLPGA